MEVPSGSQYRRRFRATDRGCILAKILFVDDDAGLCKTIRGWLAMERHTTETANTGEEAMGFLKAYEYDLIVLDWQMPGMSGIEVLKEFRARGGNTPVIMLTGRSEIENKEEGLDSGADDYLTKPFHTRELSARIRALLRRPHGAVGEVFTWRDIQLDRESYLVTKGGQEIRLLPKEFDLLEFLMRNPGKVFTSEALLNRVWSSESESTVEALHTCVKRVRKKVDTKGDVSIIRTVHGVGYSLESETATTGAKDQEASGEKA